MIQLDHLNEFCESCKMYYFDGRYSEDWCMLDHCKNEFDKNCQLCLQCEFSKQCERDCNYENIQN